MAALFKKTDKTADGGIISISYSILSIGFLILIAIVVLTRFFDWLFQWNIELKDYISMCTFGCVTIGLIYNAVSLQYNFKLNKEKFERESKDLESKRVQLTYEVVSEWYKGDMAMEHLSLLCADRVIDEQVLKKIFKTAFTSYYYHLKEFIEDIQRDNAGANSKIYINFVEITKKW